MFVLSLSPHAAIIQKSGFDWNLSNSEVMIARSRTSSRQGRNEWHWSIHVLSKTKYWSREGLKTELATDEGETAADESGGVGSEGCNIKGVIGFWMPPISNENPLNAVNGF